MGTCEALGGVKCGDRPQLVAGGAVNYQLHDNHVAALLDEAVSHVEHRRLGAIDRPASSLVVGG
jgi:hypothetical protein